MASRAARAVLRLALGDSGRRRRAVYPLVHSGTAIGLRHLRTVNVPHTSVQQSVASVAFDPHCAMPRMHRVVEACGHLRRAVPSKWRADPGGNLPQTPAYLLQQTLQRL